MPNYFQGYIPSTPKQNDRLDKFLGRVQGSPEFSDIAPHLKGRGSRKLSLPFKSVQHFFPKAFEDEAQTGPDCTSHATRNGCDISRAVEMHIKGEPESWLARGATEPIYGYRGHTGGGMSPARATTWVHKFGYLVRKKYPSVDLSKYDYSKGESWGRLGPPAQVREEASGHLFLYQARIRTVEEARDALAAGFGLHCGSQYGNDGTRNSKGIATFNSSWNHDMAWGACDETGDDLYFLILQSWGLWNRGGHPDWGPLPGGSFLIPSRDAEWCIKNGEMFAVGNFDGFPAQDLPDYGAKSFLG